MCGKKIVNEIAGDLVALLSSGMGLKRAARGAGPDPVPQPLQLRGDERDEGGGAGHLHADAG